MTLKHISAAIAVAALLVPTAATATNGKSKGASGDKPAKTHSHGKKDKKAKKGKGHGKAKNHVFKGTVVSIDAATSTVVVNIVKGNKRARAFKGTDVTFTLDKVRKIRVRDTNGDTKRDLADVQVGDRVQVQAKFAKGAEGPFAARKFKVYKPKAAKAPESDESKSDEPKPEPTPEPTV